MRPKATNSNMFNYYFDRGLSVVEHLANTFKGKRWFLPDLICDEVLAKIQEYVKNYEFYHINSDFSWSPTVLGDDPKIFYVIDYFGKECKLGGPSAPPNTTVIRDSVWFPFPYSRVEFNQIWFNSFRKIIRGTTGASVITPFRLANNEVNGIFQHPALTWKETDTRFHNFYFLRDLLTEYQVSNFVPDFPTVFPLCLPNRDTVLERAGLTGKLPGMWAGKNGMKSFNPMYNELTFIPLDSRFDEDKLAELVYKIKDAING